MPSNLAFKTGNQIIHCTERILPFKLLLILVILTSLFHLTSTAQTAQGSRFKVTIDAGHGGKDSGAPGKKSVEKNIALGIALKTGKYIESLMDDVDVYYTRKTDVFIPLYERAQIANKNKSDLFISIHVNANKKSTPTGTSTYVMGFSRSADNLDLVMQENKAILMEQDYQSKYAGFDPTSPESYIIFNNLQNNNLTQSLEIATAIQDQLRIRAQRKDIGVHQGNLVVLWGCAKPSVLVETGFISNPEEEAFLMTENGQDIIASAIYMAFRGYKESVDAKMNLLSQDAASAPVVEKKAQEIVGKTAVQKTEKDPEVLKPAEEKTKATAETSKNEINKTTLNSTSEKKVTTSPPISEKLKDTTSESGIEFRIQLLASLKSIPLNAKDFKGVKDIKEFQLDGYYKYMSPPVKDYQEALEIRRQLGTSFRGAFIVAFRNGERVPLNTIIDQKKK